MSTVYLLVTIPYAVFTDSNDCVLLCPCVFTSTIKILLRSNFQLPPQYWRKIFTWREENVCHVPSQPISKDKNTWLGSMITFKHCIKKRLSKFFIFIKLWSHLYFDYHPESPWVLSWPQHVLLLNGAETFRGCNSVRSPLNSWGSVVKGIHGTLVLSYLCVSWLTLWGINCAKCSLDNVPSSTEAQSNGTAWYETRLSQTTKIYIMLSS